VRHHGSEESAGECCADTGHPPHTPPLLVADSISPSERTDIIGSSDSPDE